MADMSLQSEVNDAGFNTQLAPVEGAMGDYLVKNKQTVLMTIPAISTNSLFKDPGLLCLVQDNETGDKTILFGRKVKLFDEDHFYVLKGANINRVENFTQGQIFVEHTDKFTRHLIFEVGKQSVAKEFVDSYKDEDTWTITSDNSQKLKLIAQ